MEANSEVCDPLLVRSPYGNTLVVGRSSTGKSMAVKAAVELLLREKAVAKDRIYSLNDRTGLLHGISKKLRAFNHIKGLPKHSVAIIEDVINLTKKENDLLRQLLNYFSHHHSIRTYVVTHHLWKTGLLTSLPFFNYVIFSNSPSSLPLIKLALGQFSLGQKEVETILNFVKEKPPSKFQYYVLDCKTLNFHFAQSLQHLIDPSEKKMETVFALRNDSNNTTTTTTTSADGDVKTETNETDRLVARFEGLVAHSKQKDQARVLFTMILECVPLNLIRPVDLSFEFRFKDGSVGQVSIVDYIFCLLSKDDSLVVKEIIFFHNYLSKFCTIPKLYIINKHFVK